MNYPRGRSRTFRRQRVSSTSRTAPPLPRPFQPRPFRACDRSGPIRCYEGPVPGGLSDGELLDVRARYLAGADQGDVDRVNDLRRWRQAIEAHESYDELVLWFEHDLFNQLNLIQLLSWIRTCVPGGKVVSLVCIGSFPDHPRFKGLGELSPVELASLFETRRPLSDAQSRTRRAGVEGVQGTGTRRARDSASLRYRRVALLRGGTGALSAGISIDD